MGFCRSRVRLRRAAGGALSQLRLAAGDREGARSDPAARAPALRQGPALSALVSMQAPGSAHRQGPVPGLPQSARARQGALPEVPHRAGEARGVLLPAQPRERARMSWEATAYVKGLAADPAGAPLTSKEKMVLFVLSDCINPYTCEGWVTGGLEALAEDALISKPGLLTVLKKLETRNLIRKDMRTHPSGRSRSNVYVFLQMPLKAGKGKAALPLELPRFSDRGGVKPDLTVRVKPDFTLEGKVQTLPSLSPNSVLVPKTPPTVPPAGGVCAGGGQAEEVLAELNRITGMHFKARHPNGALTSNGRRVVAGLKNGYTADQLIRVVRLKCRAWMGGEMQKYLRPKTLFAPENFDQYVAGLRRT